MRRVRRVRRRPGALRKTIARVVRQLAPKPELKLWESTGTGNFPSVTGALAAFPQVAQGVTQTTRIGQRIAIHSVLIRVTFGNDTANSASVQARFIVGIDRQNDQGATPTVGAILQTTGYNAPLNITTTRGQFRILHDSLRTLGPALQLAAVGVAMNAAPNHLKNVKFYKRFRYPMIQNYSSTSAGSFQSKNLFVLMLSDAAAPNDPGFNINYRVMYSDA